MVDCASVAYAIVYYVEFAIIAGNIKFFVGKFPTSIFWRNDVFWGYDALLWEKILTFIADVFHIGLADEQFGWCVKDKCDKDDDEEVFVVGHG